MAVSDDDVEIGEGCPACRERGAGYIEGLSKGLTDYSCVATSVVDTGK